MINTKKAFTLVELIISLSIFVCLIGGVTYAVNTQLRVWQKISKQASVAQTENFILTRMAADIRSAHQILPTSSKSSLVLKINNNSIEYSLSNNKLKRKKNNYSSYLCMPNEISQLGFLYPSKKTIEIFLNQSRTKVGLRN